ncbi:AMIN-like domain-containing (lipo)protein [Brachybacterium hainanense]|uniref:AMIN-like domain-containing protein n=1 Tax=Brachybacterium hainanense TaxID=1541174 RepID=A0ABV6RHP2_9MICO
MRRVIAGTASLLLAGSLGLIAPATADAAPYCGITWGSRAEARTGTVTSHLTNLRAGEHDCFDRLVIDLDHRAAGYTVRYVNQVTRPGSGSAVPLAGAADLEIVVTAAAYDSSGRPTYAPRAPSAAVDVSGYATFRQVALAGSYEGRTTIGLGVRARLPMRVLTLNDPDGGSRVVIDVAHRW